MKRQIVTFLMVLALATGTALWAQSTGTPQTPPPSQQVDQSGQPETGTGPDVDVDVGRNAEDGVMDVEVNRNADSDTAAQGNDPNPTLGTATTTDVDTDVDTDLNDDDDNLPDTASGMPLLGLIGLLALGGAVAIKATR